MRLVFSDFKERPFMSLFATASRLMFAGAFATVLFTTQAQALDLDWHGQFRAEMNTIFGYTNPSAATGYAVPDTGDAPATFQNLFFRLNPRVLVNDNVTLHSDLWLGLPDRSFFGSDGRQSRSYYSTTTGNASVTAHTLYGEIATDFGTIRVGRVPLNWGLGLVWNSKDDGFDRLPSSGDGFSLLTKLGAFQFQPAIVKYEDANASGVTGNSGASDYTVSLMYKNDDEQIDLGILFMRRIAGINANVGNPFNVPPATSTTYGYAYNVWDFYAKKRAGAFTISAEVPLASGLVASRDFSEVSGAVKVTAQATDHWSFDVNVGSASGQDNGTAGAAPSKLTAFYFHPDYRPGLILFNYNFQNLVSGVGSPYDNPITNARFLALAAKYSVGKWSHSVQGIYAVAEKAADGVAGNVYFNTLSRHYETEAGGAAQDKGLGTEFDYGIGYQWDESIRFGLDLGLYFPGKFYDFNNTATTTTHKTVFASNLNLLVKF
jgi:hypothetical protein